MNPLNSKNLLCDAVSSWTQHLVWLALFFVILSVTFFDTLASMVNVWLRSETFTHAFLILPISLWLVWDKREQLVSMNPQLSLLGLIFAVAGVSIWLVGSLIDVLLLQQLGVVWVLIGGVWSLIGNQVALVLLFPLGFLMFMVPMGGELVPAMMEFTADFTVHMVRLSGVPVFREGLYFSLPSGNWSVVEACSGVRYLIASVTLGFLYAHLAYKSRVKKLLFIIAAIIVPIIANGLRAYMIVMLGHLSDMTVATGVDHLIYGWLFFGVVIFLLITVGNWFRDTDATQPLATRLHGSESPSVIYGLGVCFTLLMITISGPTLVYLSAHQEAGSELTALSDPSDSIDSLPSYPWQWLPSTSGGRLVTQGYRYQNRPIGVVVQHFAMQTQGEELITWNNTLLPAEVNEWRMLAQNKAELVFNGKSVDIDSLSITNGQQSLLIYSWYRIGENYTSNRLKAKLFELIAKLTFQRQDAAWVVVSLALDNKSIVKDESIILRNFISESLPSMEKDLDRVASIR